MVEKPRKIKDFQNLGITNLLDLDALTKLRIIVITIFILCTISVPLLIYGYIISAFLLIISYLLIIVMMLKLLIIKKL